MLTGEHAAELELGGDRVGPLKQLPGLHHAVFVGLFATQGVEFACVVQLLGERGQVFDDLLDPGLVTQHALGTLGVVPKRGIGRLCVEFFESLLLAYEVKDASATRRCDRRAGKPGP